MPKRPKFSIITPSYNQADTLAQTIESVMRYPDLEYFIFDNLSTDGSDVIIKQYAKKHKNIIYQIKKDRGQADAINQGLKKSSGEIVAFINSDDYYLPAAFDTVSEYFKSHPECLWLVGDCLTAPKSFSWTFRLKEIVPYDRIPQLLYLFNFVNQPSVFIRKELINQAGLFDANLYYCFDYDFWLKLIKLSAPHRLRVPLAVFRITPLSKGSRGFVKQFSEDLIVVQKYTSSPVIRYLHSILGKTVVSIYQILK